MKLGKSKGEEGYGEGRAAIAFGDDVLMDEEQMVEQLLERLNAPDYRPPTLPVVAVELMSLSQRPDVELDDVARLLEQDSMLAGRVLKIVQSPIYSGANKLVSLRDALVRLGLRTLRDLVMETAMQVEVFKSPIYTDTLEAIRQHSTMTAHFSKIISNYTAMEGEYAFMAGLLHDVGLAGTLLALSDRKAGRKGAPDLVSVWPAVDRVHERAAQLVAANWKLPPELEMVIGAHHQVLIQGYAHPLAATVCLADQLAHELGFGVIPKEDSEEGDTEQDSLGAISEYDCVSSFHRVDHSTPKTLEHAQEALRLSDAQMVLIRQDAVKVVEQLAE